MIIARKIIIRRSVLVLGVSIAVVVLVAFSILVSTTVNERRNQLEELARSQARLMESVARFDSFFQSADHGPSGRVATLSQIKEAFLSYQGFDRTGEITLAEKVGDRIVFLLPTREAGFTVPDPVPFDAVRGEAMRRALRGESGTGFVRDYTGDLVLAAYQPLEFLNLGIVAKIDAAELFAPFYRAGLISAGLAAVVIAFGVYINNKTVGPLLDRVSREIAERQAAEERTAALNRNLIGLLNNSPDFIYIKDLEYRIVICSQNLAEILGYASWKDMVGKTDFDFFPAEDAAGYRAIDRPTIEEGKSVRLEQSYQLADGTRIWVSNNRVPLRDESGKIIGLVGTAVDLRERRQMEAELRQAKETAESATRAKSDFLARMSHEIRTPMNAIIGMNHLALQTDLTAKQRDYLTKSLSSARSLLEIINDILDYSKIEAGKLRFESIDFHLEQVLENLSTVTVIKAEEKGLELIFDASPDLPAVLVGDPHRLGQVLINLVNNAIKFTETGEILVSIRVLERRDQSAVLQFDVKDTGIGLTPDQTSRLFQSFEQADGSTTRKYGGTGLGLAISRNLVEMMGGRIWVHSEPNQGSTFSFTAEFPTKPAGSSPPLQPAVDLRGLKTLVVDDSEATREILSNQLTSFSFVVETARSGPEAIEKLVQASRDSSPFKLVLMDWKMPGMNGIEAALRIRANPEISHAPHILMISAHGSEEVIRQARQARLDAFLAKPVSNSVLFDTVMECFGHEPAKTIVNTYPPFPASDRPCATAASSSSRTTRSTSRSPPNCSPRPASPSPSPQTAARPSIPSSRSDSISCSWTSRCPT